MAQKLLGTVYDGEFYRDVGDFLRKSYLDEGFTRGTVQEVDFLVDLLHLSPERASSMWAAVLGGTASSWRGAVSTR